MMATSSRSARIAAMCFVLVAALVFGGLTWATVASIRLKNAERKAAAQAEHNRRLRLALWRIDPLIMNVFAKEASRPYWHYSPYYYAPEALMTTGEDMTGSVIQPSPLLNREDTAEWVLLHFQVSARSGWNSPQLPDPAKWQAWYDGQEAEAEPAQRDLLACLESDHSYAEFGALVSNAETAAAAAARWLVGEDQAGVIRDYGRRQRMAVQQQTQVQQPARRRNQFAQLRSQKDYIHRGSQSQFVLETNRAPPVCDPLNVAIGNMSNTVGADLFVELTDTDCVTVNVSAMTAMWLHLPDHDRPMLTMVRTVEAAKEKVYQGFLVDWDKLSAHLLDAVVDLFDDVRLEVVAPDTVPDPETTLASIPARLVTQPVSVASVGLWEGMDLPMTIAWIAALIALTAVGGGVRSLLSMSERRSQFAYAVTHELRTPLTTLCLYTDMLCDGLVPAENRSDYVTALRDESQRLAGLVSGILEYSRVENQTVRLDRKDVPVAELVDTLKERYAPRCDAAGLRFALDMNGLGAARVNTDPQLALQIMGNLIDNACKYAADGAAPAVTLRAARDRDAICFEIEDNGPGITRRDRRRVFRPFRRGRTAGTRKTGGVGLGLALARSWARLLGGRLDLLSNRPGGGARFRLSLPAAATAAS